MTRPRPMRGARSCPTAVAAPGPQRAILAVLAYATLMFSLGPTSVIPAITPLARSVHTSLTSASWAVTATLLSAAVLTPVIGRLGDVFGMRRMLIVVLTCVIAGNVVAAIGNDIETIVAGRALFGAGAGVFPLSFGIVREAMAPRSRAAAVGVLTAVTALGGGLGPAVGGFVVDNGSFRGIFWCGAAVALPAVPAVLLAVPRSPARLTSRVDVGGIVLLTAAITAPLIAISKANQWGWTSPRTAGLVAVAIVLAVALVRFERHVSPPLIDVGALRRPVVAATNAAALLVGFGMYSALLLIPQIAQVPRASGYGLGMGAAAAGLLLVPGFVVMLATGALSGPMSRSFGNSAALMVGAAGASGGLAALAAGHSSAPAVIGGSSLLFAGIGFAFAGIANLIVDAVPPEQTGEATGINAFVRLFGAALGAQVTISILARGANTSAGVDPPEHAYVVAFAVSAALTAAAAAIAAILHLARLEGKSGLGNDSFV
jgi:MFS family permease